MRTWQNGAGEHGAHGIVLAPDKHHIFIVCGNAVGQPTDISENSPMRNFADDRAIMRREGGFMAGEKPPGGSIHRMDLEGKNPQRFASGQRNTYDIAMNADGEVFGFDLVGRRHDLVDGEVRCGLGDLLVLVGEVFGEEAIGGGGVGDEEAAAWNPFLFGRDWRSHCGHDVTPAN